MGDHTDKKMRQMFRREIRKHLDQMTREYFMNDAPMFNTKPKWVPTKVWTWLVNFIVDRGFLIQYKIRQQKKADVEMEYQDARTDEEYEANHEGDDDIYFAEGYVDDENDATIEVDEDTDIKIL